MNKIEIAVYRALERAFVYDYKCVSLEVWNDKINDSTLVEDVKAQAISYEKDGRFLIPNSEDFTDMKMREALIDAESKVKDYL